MLQKGEGHFRKQKIGKVLGAGFEPASCEVLSSRLLSTHYTTELAPEPVRCIMIYLTGLQRIEHINVLLVARSQGVCQH